MSEVRVHWRGPIFHEEQRRTIQGKVRTGLLTDEHEAATEDVPVLVEDLSARVYRPMELPEEAILYFHGPPGAMPDIARRARDAGFVVRHAAEDPQQIAPEEESHQGADPRQIARGDRHAGEETSRSPIE